MSGVVDDFALIQLVEANPILYDKDMARGQRNASLKDKVWKELSIKLNVSERACITRWKSIRDRFGKEFRRVQENPEEPTNWDMFPHLLFLKDHYKHGNARNDAIEIKYEPRGRKRKRTRWGDGQRLKDEEPSDEVDPQEIMINRQLIALVKDHPVLYDKQKIRDSKNLVYKNAAWNIISRSLGLSEEVCFKRWKKLRDRFAREYRYQVIQPERQMTWVYFPELMFLEGHYRKGVPLKVENLKRKPKELMQIPKRTTIETPRVSIISADSPWGNDYSFVCGEETDEGDIEELLPEGEHEETYIDLENEFEDLLILPAEKSEPSHSTTEVLTEVIPISNGQIVTTVSHKEPAFTGSDSESQLISVITDMGQILRRSEDCLKVLQEENKRFRHELELATHHHPPEIVEKIQILTNGLNNQTQTKVERRILKFLCECQIKILNNEEIEDVTSVHSPIF